LDDDEVPVAVAVGEAIVIVRIEFERMNEFAEELLVGEVMGVDAFAFILIDNLEWRVLHRTTLNNNCIDNKCID
jgi:hypothetical protein